MVIDEWHLSQVGGKEFKKKMIKVEDSWKLNSSEVQDVLMKQLMIYDLDILFYRKRN